MSANLARTIKKICVFLLSFCVGIQSFAYVVQKGDSLSKIAAQHIHGRIYGPNGNLQKILAANPGIRNRDFIRVGQVIILTSEERFTKSKPLPRRQIASETPVLPISIEPEKKFSTRRFVDFAPDFSSTDIQGTDSRTGANAYLQSKLAFGVAADYRDLWTEIFQSDFYLGVHKISLAQPSGGGSVNDAEMTLFNFGARGIWQLSPKWSGGFGLGVAQRPFIRGLTSATITVDQVAVPTVDVFGDYEFFKHEALAFGGQMDVGVDLPVRQSRYDSKVNLCESARVYIRHEDASSLPSEIGVRASYQAENTTAIDQTQTEYALYLKLWFAIGH